MTLGLNSLLLRSQGRLILIETGAGDKPNTARQQSTPVEQGTLLSDLKALGVTPEEIEIVINTHLHSDHCGWNSRYVDGKLVPSFSNAEYLMMGGEWDAFWHPNERTRATYLVENLEPLQDMDPGSPTHGEFYGTFDLSVFGGDDIFA